MELGAKVGLVAADQVTDEYLKDGRLAPKAAQWEQAVGQWKSLPRDAGAIVDA